MKRFGLIEIVVLMCLFAPELRAGDTKKVYNGYEGGMMVHTGYLYGSFPHIGHSLSGMPIGIGGLIKIRLGEHWRVGTEGYVSTLPQLKNGSYSKYGWGGLLGDFYWPIGRFVPYAGVTIGGGANSNLLVLDEKAEDWKPLENSYFNRRGFFAVAPFAGCSFVVSDSFQLTLKADWLNCISRADKIPSGPRLYIGFIFCH